MASALNMDEGSDTTTQTHSVEETEKEGKMGGWREGRKHTGRQINKVEPQVAIVYQ